jgi:two-component system, NarL family, nitrate/nitrite response regulator NarL
MISPRQAQIVELIAGALTDRQIACELGISPYTVNAHTKRLYKQFGAHSRMDLVNKVDAACT